MVAPPTGTLTFLFTDIEGSTRLWESEPELMKEVVERHDELLEDVFDSYEGYVFSTAGDSFAAAFASPRATVDAAVAIQRGLGRESWDVGDVLVRIGIHSGVAHERDGDYFGPTLSRAARIMSAGHGGQILLSQTTSKLVEGSLPAEVGIRLLGEFRLKDLGAPQRLFQLVHPDLEDSFPPVRTLDNHRNNLPVESSSFVGRHRELQDIEQRLEEARLVTLTGVGGAGKTRLALQAAANNLDHFPDGVWVIELASLVDPDELPGKAVDVIDISGGPGETPAGSTRKIADYLASRRALLLLDNCEHLILSAAEFSDFLLRRCPDLKILATSREGLGIAGEHLIQVPSLALPSVYAEEGSSSRAEAVELFAERAFAVDSTFELNSQNQDAVAEICRRLDGMPLAIELAAARMRVLPPEQIAQRLSDTFRLLTGGARTALPRQQTLRATVDWSYNLLTDSEKSLFVRLAVFRGGFTLETTEAIVSGDGVDEKDVFEMLASLVDKSMVQAADQSGRFSMLETLRQYAQDRLADTGQIDDWRRRHAEFYANSADLAYDATRDRRQAEWLERLEGDHENFKTALTWAIETGETRHGARIAIGLYWFWVIRSHIVFGEETLSRLIEMGGLETAEQAMAYHARAWMRIVRYVPSGLEDAQRAAFISNQLEDDRLRARTSVALIPVLGSLGRYDEEQIAFTEAYEAGRRAGDNWVMGRLALNHGFSCRLRAENAEDPRLDEADKWYESALRHSRASGVQLGQANALSQKATIRASKGDIEGTLELVNEANELYQTLGDMERRAGGELLLSSAMTVNGRPEEAIDHAILAISLLNEIGANTLMASAILATAMAENGDFAGGIRTLSDSVDELPKAERGIADRFCLFVARFAIAGGAYDAAAKLMMFAGGDDQHLTYFGLLSDTVIREVHAELNKQLPKWREVGGDWDNRPLDDVVPLVESILDRLAAQSD